MPKSKKEKIEESIEETVGEIASEPEVILTVESLVGKQRGITTIVAAQERLDGTVELTLDDGTTTVVPSLEAA